MTVRPVLNTTTGNYMDNLHERVSGLLETAREPLPDRDMSRIVIYGAGNCGRRVAKSAKHSGMEVVAFLDVKGDVIHSVEGLPCYAPDSTESRSLARQSIPVVIAVFNHATNPVPICDGLRIAGFDTIISYYEAHERCGMAPDYWVAPRLALYEKRREILAGLSLFLEQQSRQLYHDYLALRLSFDQALLSTPALGCTYLPGDLPQPRQPMRLVDGGAFNGDTVGFFLGNEISIQAVAAFEPDVVNYAGLVEAALKWSSLDVETCLFPCGLAEKTAVVRFQGGDGEGSRLAESGSVHVQVVALDDVLPDYKPSLIKLDIEGAEPDALRGAHRNIVKYGPELAVSVYHAPHHIWQIPAQIRSMLPDHRLYLRSHWYNGFDTVVYAFPE